MTESPEFTEPEAEIPDPSQFEQPDDLDEDDYDDEHNKEDVGGPGGIVNYPPETHPEGWEYVEGESSPPVEEI